MHAQGHMQIRQNPWTKMHVINVNFQRTAMQLGGLGETSFPIVIIESTTSSKYKTIQTPESFLQ